MKPIELTIKGLNSFREEQVIDFETLCADGLFGIFGPTGSGKSTVLDGITLALYGTVERAANHINGILNQLEDQMSVGFTFELSGVQPVRYRAERSYKRTKDGGLRLASCRLLKFGKGRQVIADKERDLTRSVQEILGLTHDDFTRAVVLPQGKFAEFLTLKGSERRQMLQRLFHLEKYGDELGTKLKEAAEERKHALEIITEKQAMLGDASEQAVLEARAHCMEIERQLRSVRETFAKTETIKLDYEMIRGLTEDKEAKARALQKLQQEDMKYQAIKDKLKLDEAADKLIPYMETLIDAEKEAHEAKDTYNAQITERAHAQEQLAAAREAGEQAKHARDQREPELEAEKQRLIQGISIQAQLKNEQALFIEQNAKQTELTAKQKHILALADQEQAQLGKLKADLEHEERMLAQYSINSQDRARVQQALAEKKEIDLLERYLEEKRGEWKTLRDAWRSCQQIINELEQARTAMNEKACTLFRQHQFIYNQAIETNRMSGALQTFIDMQNKKMDQRYEEMNRHKIALQLAEALHDGEPCPVCGALDHPNPAAADLSITENEVKDRQNAYQHASESLLDQIQKESLLIAQMEQQASMFPESAMHIKNESKVDQEISADFTQWAASGIQEPLSRINRMVKEQKQEQLRIGEQLSRLLEDMRKNETEYSKVKAQADMDQEKMNALQIQAVEKKHEFEKRLRQWKEVFYPTFEQMAQEDQVIRASDEKTELLQRSIQTLKDQLKPLELKADRDREQLRTLDSQLSELHGRTDSLKKSIQQWRLRMQKLGLDEREELKLRVRETEQERERLKNEYVQADQHAHALLERFHQIDKSFANASDRVSRAEHAQQIALEKWEKRLETSQFDEREQVAHAHLDESSRNAMKRALSLYEEQTEKLTSEIRSLDGKLAGRQVTQEVLEKITQQWTTLKMKVQSLTEAFGAAVKERENREKNHQLFLQLESERKKNQKTFDQFEKLQRIFRGNAFVEFVAQEQLQQVCAAASKRLGELTHGRYVLEVDAQGGFIIRDNGNGGIKRPVSSLSGGETFLTSLALALSLSEQIQLRGHVPLQFFFLDEGFGSLDPDLLDMVVTALEKLHMHRLAIGVISHVPEMRDRLPRKLIVTPAIPSGRGSRVHMEMI
ncbi:AAA family ATPase [Sporolactobacillus sp. CPB3-1]|uniref:Nuclease SbcCD subunit C n=1 Tax=Sporolactobacillus mangiferae TaxID=2940498 RepID=A0ABT0M9X5_9BACL|nr:AAA family ATPase [Sporolactobacillus mangiferae]MCL1631069.1 AAA family ATPase [Sporolactobacillus mangiferae]